MPATLALVGAIISWGFTPVMLRYLANHVPDGFTANIGRYPIAAAVYLPWLIIGIRKGRLGSFWLTALIPTAINLVMQTLWAWAPYYLDAGMLAFLFRLCTVWAILGAFLLFPDERKLARKPRFWLGTLLAFAGFVVMSLLGNPIKSPTYLTGVIIVFFCTICWGMYGVAVRYTMRNLHPLMVFSVISVYTSIGLICMAPLGDPGSLVRLEPFPLAILILSSLVGIALAHGLFYFAIQRIGVAICSLVLMVSPFVSILAAYVFLGERFSAGQWIGGLILVAGAMLALWSQERLTIDRVRD